MHKATYAFNSDPVTKKFMASSCDRVFGFPQFVRFSWSTATKVMDKNGVAFKWWVYRIMICVLLS